MLTREKVQVAINREDLRFHVEFIFGGVRVAARDDTEGGVVGFLDVLDGGRRSIWGPDRSSVIQRRGNVGLIRADEGLFRAAP